MKLNYKHALALIALVFFMSAPTVAALENGNAVVAQDIGEDFFVQLIENGAEVVFANIDEQGQPAVIYGQLGVPDEQLGLEEAMYEGCIAMALVATQGELLAYVLDLVGDELFNFTGDGGEFMPQQFDGEDFDFEAIFDYLGTDFSLMFNVFVNVAAGEAGSRMSQIRSHMASNFGFAFSLLLDLRIDESFFPEEMEIELPFDSIHVYIHQVTNTFENAVDAVLDVMDQSGFLQSIDRTVFSDAPASGAGILAVPDMGDLIDLIEGFDNGTSPMSYVTSQMPDLDGPLAIAAAGYIGDQVISSDTTEIKVFEDLLGKSPAGVVNSLATGQSLVVLNIPENMNLTSYLPENEAGNVTFYDDEMGMVFWNATAFTDQPDYSVSFEEGDFPPLVTITRTFTPATTSPGGSTLVTVTVTNMGPEEVYNVTVSDVGFASRYPLTTVTGDTSANTAVLLAGTENSLNITYTVEFPNEGRYTFDNAEVTYEFEGNDFTKRTHVDAFDVTADPVGLLSQMISDGWPYTGIVIGVVGLGAVINIVMMFRGKGGSVYQV
jgi:hypothetical protein